MALDYMLLMAGTRPAIDRLTCSARCVHRRLGSDGALLTGQSLIVLLLVKGALPCQCLLDPHYDRQGMMCPFCVMRKLMVDDDPALIVDHLMLHYVCPPVLALFAAGGIHPI